MPFVLQFSCRVGNNHQIHCLILYLEKKGEQKKACWAQTFREKGLPLQFWSSGRNPESPQQQLRAGYWCHQWTRWRLLGVRPSWKYTHTHMQLLSAHIQPLLPITTHNSLSKEMSCHHFPNWAPFLSCDVHLTARNHCQLIIWSFVYLYHEIQFWIEILENNCMSETRLKMNNLDKSDPTLNWILSCLDTWIFKIHPEKH